MDLKTTMQRCELVAHFADKAANASHLDEAQRAGRAALTELSIVLEYLRERNRADYDLSAKGKAS